MHHNDNKAVGTTRDADLWRDGYCAKVPSALEWLEMANAARRRAMVKTGQARKVWAEAARLSYERARRARLMEAIV